VTRPRTGSAEALLELRAALVVECNQGRTVPCHVDPEPFTSEEITERAEAAAACRVCPVLIECARFALLNEESNHVWGGADVTRRPAAAMRWLEELVGEGASEVHADATKTAAVPRLLSPSLSVMRCNAKGTLGGGAS
jgi:hypothetical protein